MAPDDAPPPPAPSAASLLPRLRVSGAVDRLRKAIESRLVAADAARKARLDRAIDAFLATSPAHHDIPALLQAARAAVFTPQLSQSIRDDIARAVQGGWLRDMLSDEVSRMHTRDAACAEADAPVHREVLLNRIIAGAGSAVRRPPKHARKHDPPDRPPHPAGPARPAPAPQTANPPEPKRARPRPALPPRPAPPAQNDPLQHHPPAPPPAPAHSPARPPSPVVEHAHPPADRAAREERGMRAASRKDAPLGQRVAKSLPPTHPTAEPQHRVAPPVPVAKPLPPTHPTAEPQHRVAPPVPDHAAAAAAASPDAGAVAKGTSGKRSAFSEVAVPLGKLESAKSFGGKASTDNSQLELGCAESPRVADGKAGEDPTPAKATSVLGSAERTQANEKILQPLQQPSSTPGQVKSPITVSESALVKKPKNGTSLDTEGKESQVTPPTNENIEPRDEDVKTTPIEVASKDKGKPVAAGNKISAESRDGDGEQSDGHRKSVSSKGEEKLEKHPKRATSPVRNGGKAADKKRSDGNSEQSGKLEERDNNAETRKLSSTNYGDEKNVKNPITLSPNLESKVHQPKSSNKTIEEATAGAGTRNLPKKLPGVEAMQIESKKTERVDMETDKSARTSDVVEKQPSTHGSAPTVSNEGGALKVLNREQSSPSHRSPGTDREREATGTNGKTPSPPLSSTIGGKQALGQSEKSSPTPSSSLEDGDKGTARKQKSPSKSLSPAVSDRGKAEKALERFVRTSGSKKPEDVAIRQVDQKSEKHRPQRKDAKVSSDKSDRKAGKVSGKERISKPSSYDTQSTEKSQGKENFKSGKSTKRKRRSEADKPTAEEPDQNPSGSPKKRPRIHNSDTRCVPQDLEEQKNILRALRELMEKDYAEVFLEPVDPSEKGCAAYYTVIKKAMDLGTIEKRLDQATSQNAYYAAKTDIFADIELVWSNCRQFNGMFDPIIGDVEKCMAFLDAALEKYGVESGANKDNQRRRSRSRSLKRKFEDSQLTERPKKQQQQRKKAKPKADDLNDGRLVGKVVAVFTRRGPRKAKAWTRVKVVDFLERSQSYKLQWLDDGKITYNATFGMNETFPVFRQ